MKIWKFGISMHNVWCTFCQRSRCDNVWKLQGWFCIMIQNQHHYAWEIEASLCQIVMMNEMWAHLCQSEVKRERQEYIITKGHHETEVSTAVRQNGHATGTSWITICILHWVTSDHIFNNQALLCCAEILKSYVARLWQNCELCGYVVAELWVMWLGCDRTVSYAARLWQNCELCG
jgi:hypothetical protein